MKCIAYELLVYLKFEFILNLSEADSKKIVTIIMFLICSFFMFFSFKK